MRTVYGFTWKSCGEFVLRGNHATDLELPLKLYEEFTGTPIVDRPTKSTQNLYENIVVKLYPDISTHENQHGILYSEIYNRPNVRIYIYEIIYINYPWIDSTRKYRKYSGNNTYVKQQIDLRKSLLTVRGN